MGLTLDALNRFAEAIVAFENVVRLRGEDPDLLLHISVDLIRTEQHGRAVNTLQRALKLSPEFEPAYCQLILAHSALGDHDQAEQAFYLARQIVDECPHCYNHMAESLATRGELDRAVWCWHQCLRLEPRHPDANANLAITHWQRGQHERALQYFLQQLRLEPGDTDSLLHMGNLLVEMGRPAEAGEKFRRVLELQPTHATAHLHLGELALDIGHLDAAQAKLELAGSLSPSLLGVHFNLARVAMARDDKEQARSHLRAELDQQGHTPEQLLELGRTLIDLAQPDIALPLLTKLIEALSPNPQHESLMATALMYRGAALLLLSRCDEGIRDCRRALRLSPRLVPAMQNLALAYTDKRRFDRARYWLRRAAQLGPGDPFLNQMAARLRRDQFLAWLDRWRGRLLLLIRWR